MLLTPASGSAYTLKQTEEGERVRWHEATVALRLDPSVRRAVADGEADRAAEMAAEAWRGLPGVPDVVIRSGSASRPGFDPAQELQDHGIFLVEDMPELGGRLAVTVATYEEATGRLLDADVLIDGERHFAVADEDGREDRRSYDLGAVLAHELGHALGLGESAERGATMWPRIRPGDTHQRTLETDDEEGALAVYRGLVLAPAAGCGGSSVPAAAGWRPGWLVVGLGVLGGLALLALWRRHNRVGAGRRGANRAGPAPAGSVVLAAAVLFLSAGPVPHEEKDPRVRVARTLAWSRLRDRLPADTLTRAIDDPSPMVRVAAAAVLESTGTFEDRELARNLTHDPDPSVRRAAQRAMARLSTAPPAAALPASDPAASEALAGLLDGSTEQLVGRAHTRGAAWSGGLLGSEVEVTGAGSTDRFLLPGGCLDGICQRFGDVSLPPDGAEIFVAIGAETTPRWTLHAASVLYGGWLGDAVAVELGAHPAAADSP